jgi:hypothetical protein
VSGSVKGLPSDAAFTLFVQLCLVGQACAYSTSSQPTERRSNTKYKGFK